jgi:hypothetical protein
VELVELVVQGLKGATEMSRVGFQPNVTLMPAGAREQIYARVILDLLYPKGTEPALSDLVVPNQPARVGLTVVGRDQQKYRLLQDVATGRRALQKLAGDQAQVITSSAAEISQAVTATLGFPQEDILRELLFCIREDLPSKRKDDRGRSSSTAPSSSKAKIDKPLPPGFGDVAPAARIDKPLPPGFSDEGAPVRAPGDEDSLRRRLAEIEATLSSQQGVKDLEFEIDGLQKKLFEIEGRLKPLITLRRSVQQAEEQVTRFAKLADIPGDLVEKGERLRKIRQEHDRDTQRIGDERASLLESASTLDARGRQRPLEVAKKDKLVLGGVGVGIGGIALALIGAAAFPPLQWAAFLDIPGFAVAVWGGIRVLSSLEEGEAIRRRIVRLDAEKKKLEEKFRVDEENLESLLKRYGFKLEELPEVEAQLRARDDAKRLLEQTRAALAEAQQGGDVGALEAEQHAMQARLRELEEQLQTQGGYGAGGDLEREKAEILAALDKPQSQAEEMAAPFGMEPDPEPVAAPSGPARDWGQRQLQLARDILMQPVEEIAPLIQQRVGQIITALSDGRFNGVRFSGTGEVRVVDAAAEEEIPFGNLPAGDRDIAFLSVKIALVEAICRKQKAPVIFDRGLDGFPDAKAPLLLKMMQFLAGMTQVVCITEKRGFGV